MSERKSAEIKFRCTPSFKANVQADAQAADENVSEYIEAAVELRRRQEKDWARRNQQLDGIALINNAIHSLDPESEQAEALEHATPAEGGLYDLVVTTFTEIGEPLSTEEVDARFNQSGVACACRPWEFCTHKAGA